MLFYFSQLLREWAAGTSWAETLGPLRLFNSITFRSAGASLTALALCWWLGPKLIAWLQRVKFSHPDRVAGSPEPSGTVPGATPASDPRLAKRGTPTMGGLLIVAAMDLSALMWTKWNEFVELTLISVVVLAGLGFFDDWAKITKQNSAGLAETAKLITQFALGGLIAVYLWQAPDTSRLITEIMVPFYKHPILSSAAVGIVITVFAVVGSSNAVNLTDGMDGLAIGCTLIVSVVFLVLTYVAGNVKLATYLQVPYVPGAGELTVFCAAMIGAGLGFLWFNCHPAQIFMGDTGSLALGGALGLMAVLIHQPFVLVIAGGVFVIEAGSVLIQRGWFKYTRRRRGVGVRVFRMAPLHHHFEKKGWHESQVVMRFYILCFLFAVLALSTLKIR